MEQKVYELIESYRDEFVRMLQEWIRTPSVKGEAEDGAPGRMGGKPGEEFDEGDHG